MRKTLQDYKAELINGLISARQEILDILSTVPKDKANEIFLGSWNIKDLMAHLIGWDYTNLQAIQEINSGIYPSFFQHYDKNWQSYNAYLVQQYRNDSLDELYKRVIQSHMELIQFLESLSADIIVKGKSTNPRGRTVTIRNLLRSEAGDEREHARQLAAYFQAKQAERIG